jgi:hypothetical protein
VFFKRIFFGFFSREEAKQQSERAAPSVEVFVFADFLRGAKRGFLWIEVSPPLRFLLLVALRMRPLSEQINVMWTIGKKKGKNEVRGIITNPLSFEVEEFLILVAAPSFDFGCCSCSCSSL